MQRLIYLSSTEELRAQAANWDDLWRRSDVASPLAQAELVAQWVERFSPLAPFRALVVEEDGRWSAALPLAETRVLRLLEVAMPTANSWMPGGRLLVDPRCDVEGCLDRLVDGMAELPWKVLWLDEAPLDSPSWVALQAAFLRAGLAVSVLDRHRVAWLDNDQQWESFNHRRSKNFREQMSRFGRRLRERGEVCFRAQYRFSPPSVEDWLERGFQVEDRNWKGRSGTSVISAGMLPFFLGQGRQLAANGQLHLALLEVDGRPIAFAYNLVGKGVCHILKIGYDQQFADCRPGHLLVQEMYRQWWHDPSYRAVDWMANVMSYQLRWKPRTYRIGRIVVGLRGISGRASVYAHARWWPRLRSMKRYLTRRDVHATAERQRGS